MAYTYTFTSNPGNLFNISGNTIRVNNSTIAAGSYPVTVRANDGAGSIIDQVLILIATGIVPPPAPALKFDAPSNSQYVGTVLGGV